VPANENATRRIYSIGHSTHPIDEFLVLLKQHQIAALADVRSYPASRRWPHFSRESLAQSVESAGIEYRWIKSLGGRRKPMPADSPHPGWEHPAFRAYAEYADSAEFMSGLDGLSKLAELKTTAYMCSEGLWWKCHRRIISDHLVVRRWGVVHIMPDGKLTPHSLPKFARVADGKIVYDDLE
jgi:uncharacterized protein (DUF488 family)